MCHIVELSKMLVEKYKSYRDAGIYFFEADSVTGEIKEHVSPYPLSFDSGDMGVTVGFRAKDTAVGSVVRVWVHEHSYMDSPEKLTDLPTLFLEKFNAYVSGQLFSTQCSQA